LNFCICKVLVLGQGAHCSLQKSRAVGGVGYIANRPILNIIKKFNTKLKKLLVKFLPNIFFRKIMVVV